MFAGPKRSGPNITLWREILKAHNPYYVKDMPILKTSQVKPVLIAGPTASGKSSLGLRIAREFNGIIINADALQVYSKWNILSARPSAEDLSKAPHVLYGHIGDREEYSVGHWLNEVRREIELARAKNKLPIILGGTGLYFQSLTSGLAPVPKVTDEVRAQGNIMRNSDGARSFIEYLSKYDPETLRQTDENNPMRLQRAWEVLVSTGRGLSDWHRDTPKPDVSLEEAIPIVLKPNVKWLNNRIELRAKLMTESGALEECRAAMTNDWDPTLASSQAIGATDFMSYLKGEVLLDAAITEVATKTQQYAKRQRTWFRSKMKAWTAFDPAVDGDLDSVLALIEQKLCWI